MVLATAGIQANPAVALLAALDQQRGVATTTDANRAPTLEGRGLALLADFERMIQAAQNARIAFYTVAPGAEAPVENSAEFGSAGPNADRPLPRDFAAVEASSSIARMAGATGGASFTIGSDLDRRLEGVAADVDASYSLGFTTGAEAGDKDHRIEVRTRRAGFEVRHRESFRRRSAPDRAAASLAAAVTFGQAENPLEITLKLGAGKPDGKKKTGEIVPLAVGMPLRLLTLVPEAEVRRGKVSVRVAIQDARGRLLESPAAIGADRRPGGPDAARTRQLLVPPRRDAPRARAPARRGRRRRRALGRAIDGVRGDRDSRSGLIAGRPQARVSPTSSHREARALGIQSGRPRLK